MSVAGGADGRALLHCHAGCTPEAITAALGLTLANLMPEQAEPMPTSKPAGESTLIGGGIFPTAAAALVALERQRGPRAAAWVYHRASGEPVGVVARWDLGGGRKDVRPVSRRPAGWTIGAMPTPRPLYQLPHLLARADERVYVAEGEKCSDALAGLGLLATTSAGGAMAARQSDWRPLAGRDVVIVPDEDDAGAKYAADVVGILTTLTPPARVRVVRLRDRWHDLRDGGDIADVVERGEDSAAIEANLAALVDGAEPQAPAPSGPMLEPFQAFPVDALPNRLRLFVEAVAAATGTDPAFAAMAALVVVAGCIGNRVAVLVKSGWTEPAVLWGVLVGRSGTTKSPVLKLVTRALIDLFKAERRAFADAMKEYLREVERHEVRLAEWKKSQRSGPPTDPPDEPERPTERRLLVSDITIEKLGELLEQNPLGLLLVRDELAAWVGAFDRYAAGGKGSDQPAWLSMYDAAPVTIDRKSGKGNYFVERAAVSVLGSIQPGTLSRIFGTAEREAGLLARVLVAYPPDRPALWTEAALPDEVAADWRQSLEALLALPAAVDEHGDPRPRFIRIGKEAKTVWIEWHDHHARELVDISNDDLAAHHAKLKGVCARIALLFACVEVVAGGDAAAYISADAMRRAIAVVEWFKSEARRVYAVLGESEEQRTHRQLIQWIERRGGAVTVRELTHNVRQYHGRADAAKADLDTLAEAGCGAWEHPAPGPKGGRPSPRFVLATLDTNTKTPAGAISTAGSGSGGDMASSEMSEDDSSPDPMAGGTPDAADSADWGEV
ncbi:MAG: DUF3987 domain-containing protein [Planctomycetota bacterium]